MEISQALAIVAFLHAVMLFRITNQSETNNICPSSKCCYPEERCTSHGLHSIERIFSLRHRMPSRCASPLYAYAAAILISQNARKICELKFPGENRFYGDKVRRAKLAERNWVHPSDRQCLTVIIVKPHCTLPVITKVIANIQLESRW